MFKLTLLFLSIIGCSLSYKDPHYKPNRSVMVHLFEWKWKDIALECEQFLGPKGYGGVQVSPVSENVIIKNRPWWERYQPVSYKLITRSGDEAAFADMVKRCNAAGVRIYVDVVINHMTGDNGDIGTGGSRAQPKERKYPGVPYGPSDFNNPSCVVVDFGDPKQVRNCELLGLKDLNQGSEYVRGKILEFLNHLVKLGVAGFRIDASKHMWPGDLRIIYDRINNLNTTFDFPKNARPYIYQEVYDSGNDPIPIYEYTPLAAVTEFRFGSEISNVFRGNNALKWLQTWGPHWGLVPDGDGLVFVDNHDNQRGHDVGGMNVITHKQPKQYKGAVAFTLAHPYGEPRIMSSYGFEVWDNGPPQDSQENIISPIFNADDSCGGGWICEHRWRQIYQMVAFRNIAHGTHVDNWWDNGNNQIAFCRGNKAFIAMNNEGRDLNENLQTCLPSGKYCDVISGRNINNTCTGKTITVNDEGRAQINVSTNDYDMHVAIHVGKESKLK